MTVEVVEGLGGGAVHHVPVVTHHKLLVEEGVVWTQVGILPLQTVTHVVHLAASVGVSIVSSAVPQTSERCVRNGSQQRND